MSTRNSCPRYEKSPPGTRTPNFCFRYPGFSARARESRAVGNDFFSAALSSPRGKYVYRQILPLVDRANNKKLRDDPGTCQHAQDCETLGKVFSPICAVLRTANAALISIRTILRFTCCMSHSYMISSAAGVILS